MQRYYDALGLEMPEARNALASPAQAGYNDSVDKLIDAFINGNLEGGPGNGIFQGTDREDAASNAGAQAAAGNRSGVQEGNGRNNGNVEEASSYAGEGHGRLTVAEEALQSFQAYGIPSHIINGEEWTHEHPAYTRNGEVFLRNDIPEIFRGMVAAHEITHAMKQLGYRPYLDFMERTPDMINSANKESRRLLQAIADHQGIDPFTANRKELNRLYDELNATVYGHFSSGQIDEWLASFLHSAFNDFDAYAAELRSIHEQFRRSRSPGQVEQNTQRAEGTAHNPFGALRFAHSDSGSIDPLSSLLASYHDNPSPTAEDDYALLSAAFPDQSPDFFSALGLDPSAHMDPNDSSKHSIVGLTSAEKQTIMNETGWSENIVNRIGSMEEYRVYKGAGLKEAKIYGRACLVKDIDWSFLDHNGLSNFDRIELALSPIDAKTGEVIALHHLGQSFLGPFIELSTTSEHGDGNHKVLHPKRSQSWRSGFGLKNQFHQERRAYWKARAGGGNHEIR